MTSAHSAIQRLPPISSLRDTVERSLLAAIASGEIAPGSVVSVPTLAVRFGVSATPVREAMLNLAKLGFVEPLRNKGFRVTDVSEEDLRELVQVRRWLEAPAMRIVAEKLAGQSVARYRALADKITAAAGRSDFIEYLAVDAEFHLALLELADNRRLVNMVTDLRRQTRLVGLASLGHSAELKISSDEHHALLELLAAGRGEEAERLMHIHIGHVTGWWAGRTEAEAYGNGFDQQNVLE
jgi:DNA-binding GntR family transcriptional regulator